jgi:hypothetical protein
LQNQRDMGMPVGAASGTTKAAVAKDTVKSRGMYGITLATSPQDTVKSRGMYGVTTATSPQDTVKAKGLYGITTATSPQDTVKAKGMYGITTAGASQSTTAHAASGSDGDGANGWRIAAVSEAALLAALALGSVLLLPARRRAPVAGM